MTYFRTGTPYYHRRAAVSRSCSGWEGVGPAGYGRQALSGEAATRVVVLARWEGKEGWAVSLALRLTIMESSRTDY